MDSTPQPTERELAIASEQEFVDTAYRELDTLRETYALQLDRIRRRGSHGSAGEKTERDSFAAHYEDNLSRVNKVENRLVVGRLDYTDGNYDHIGRISLRDKDQNIILLDWRAPSSRAFYQATAKEPMGATRRRHILTRFRRVIDVEDDVLNHEGTSPLSLTGEGALMNALAAARSGKMNDIVATIQSEQDTIIRASTSGALVVQGGPGSGKTAVALHRAAYLLYAHRERLSRSGVLMVGPSAAFLSYIDRVLPALGESDVVNTTMGELIPGISTFLHDSPEIARIKGKMVWVDIIRRAVHDFLERPLHETKEIRIDHISIYVTPDIISRAQMRARRRHLPHNEAYDAFSRSVLEDLAEQYAKGRKMKLADYPSLKTEVAQNLDVRRTVNVHWLPAHPLWLLEHLFARPALLARLAPELTADERAALMREKGSPLTVEDVAILDECAELLGQYVSPEEKSRQAAKNNEEKELRSYVAKTMDSMHLGAGIVSADALAERVSYTAAQSSLAERAMNDRTWSYGHIVVDEAQELSPLQWNALLRRCPSRSMTIVGDVDQKPAGAPTGGWKELVGRISEHAEIYTLTTCYRTPGSIIRTAQNVLAEQHVSVSELTSVREEAHALCIKELSEPLFLKDGEKGELTHEAREWIFRLLTHARKRLDHMYGAGLGTLSLICPNCVAENIRRMCMHTQEWADYLRQGTLQVSNVWDCKGMEFDGVIVVNPKDIYAQGPGDAYVALTRATQFVYMLSDQPLSQAYWKEAEEFPPHFSASS